MPNRRYALLMLPLLAAAAVAAPLAPRTPPAHDSIDRQAAGVAEWLVPEAPGAQPTTGSTLFDDEWTFGAWQMAALGFAEHATTHPAAKAADLAHMDAALTEVMSPEGRAFDQGQWGTDVLSALDEPSGHMAWLGYTNLPLSARRALEPNGPWAAENDRLSAAIVRRLEAELLPETYPGQRFPVDIAAGVASVGLWARATGNPEPAVLTTWRTFIREHLIVDGVLVQAVSADGTARDRPRGSGTFLASWFLSFWDQPFAAELYRSGRARLFQPAGPYAAMREYPPGIDGSVDIDSGPIVAGLGVSATGFAIGAALAAGDTETAEALTGTATLIGRPVDENGVRHWATGKLLGSAPLADAILFAMMATVPP